ncbi:hypothetical protein JKG47_01830 [Acidithiobacillus sp. MC6.1]|nr:hypothetical protein [Acidithiobacillus sp. MC6.1]
MSSLLPLEFESHTVRVQIDDASQPWFNANDVCAIFDYTNPHKTVADHVDMDDLTKREVIDAMGRAQLSNFVNESGLYALIFGSTKDAARRFKRWVTHEVLPAIRQTGSYTSPSTSQSSPDIFEPETVALLGDGFSVLKNRIQYHGQDLQKISTEFNACLRAAALAAKHLGISDQDWILAHAIRNLRHTTGVDMRVLTGARTLIPYSDDFMSPADMGYELGFSKHPADIVNLLLSEIGYQERGYGSTKWVAMGAGLPLGRARMTEMADEDSAENGANVIRTCPVLYWNPVVLHTLSDFLSDMGLRPAQGELTNVR